MKTSFILLLLILIGAGGWLAKSDKIDQPFAKPSELKLTCTDSDGGEDINTKGKVSYSEPTEMREGEGVRVLSNQTINLKIGNQTQEIILEESRVFNLPDQVFYSKSDDSTADVLIELPTELSVNEINFISPNNPKKQRFGN